METLEANESVKHALEKQASQQKAKKLKVHTHFTEPRLADTYAAKNRNAPSQWRFKAKFPDLGESTACSFKMKYLTAIAR